MKKNLLFAFVVIFATSCVNNSTSDQKNQDNQQNKLAVEKIEVKTNYYDITPEANKTLQSLFQSKDLKTLNESNLYPLQEFLLSKVLTTTQPGISMLKNNYFFKVYNALPSFVDPKERHQGYYAGESNASENKQLLAYSLYRIDRSAENIQQIFDVVKPVLQTIISSEQYDYLQLNLMVSTYLGIYDRILEVEDYETKLAKAYTQIENSERILDAYELSEIISTNLGWGRYDNFYSNPELSFWMRRNHEGNMDTVHHILTQIEDMYLEDSY